MFISLAELMIAFKDGTKQEEKSQTVYRDRFISDAYNLKEYNLNIAMFNDRKEIPPDIASFKAYSYSITADN